MPKLPDLIPMLRQLVATPSVSCTSPSFDQSNHAVVELLADWASALGFRAEILPIPGHPGKYNLLATLGQERGLGGGLVLAGHTDTVPYDQARWSHDPFHLTETGGRLYGLGTSDMKGFFALALEAVRRLELRPEQLRRPLVLLGTADEESSMCGAQSLLDSGRRLGARVVIGEPTGLRPIRQHKGILMEAITLHGQAGHSSDPSLGHNALEGMHRVIGALLAWRDQLQAQHYNPAFHVPVPTLNLGHIHGGDNPNRICGECELHLDLRPLPGMPLEQLRQQLLHLAQHAVAGSGLSVSSRPLFSGIDAMETPAQAALVRAVEQLTGHSAGAVAFATEAPYFARMDMECLVLGPGDIDQAHQPDEYLGLDRLSPGIHLFSRLIHQFCLEPEADPPRPAG